MQSMHVCEVCDFIPTSFCWESEYLCCQLRANEISLHGNGGFEKLVIGGLNVAAYYYGYN